MTASRGHEDRWIVEESGIPVAELVEFENVDMFWEAYNVIPFNERDRLRIESEDFWFNTELAYRSKHFSDVVISNAICLWNTENKRVIGRGLYIVKKRSVLSHIGEWLWSKI